MTRSSARSTGCKVRGLERVRVLRHGGIGAAKSRLAAYVADVRGRKFPEPRHAYEMAEGEDFT